MTCALLEYNVNQGGRVGSLESLPGSFGSLSAVLPVVGREEELDDLQRPSQRSLAIAHAGCRRCRFHDTIELQQRKVWRQLYEEIECLRERT